MEDIVNLPTWGQFELIHHITNNIADFEWPISFGLEFVYWMSGFEVYGFQPY
jgi:hypothetical protein